MKTLSGIAASPGIAFGNAVRFIPCDLSVPEGKGEGLDRETARLDKAIGLAVAELIELKGMLTSDGGAELAHIFRSQQTIIEDDSLRSEMVAIIAAEGCNAERATEHVFADYAKMFEELGQQDYNRERAADLRDVQRRLMRKLLGVAESDLSRLEPSTIVVAPELLPSDTAIMDRANVCGLITEKGGITSHTAILAKSLGIPAAVSVSGAVDMISAHEELILDASNPGEAVVYVQPDGATRQSLDARKRLSRERNARFASERKREPVTPDGHRMILSANIGAPEDLAGADEYGVTSVGLFRTEFLFMKSSLLPTEEEQYEAYCAARDRLSGGMLIIRTLDVGGDKGVPSIPLPSEANPFLGYRALRVSLEHGEMFKTQLRAALRASAVGDVRIMFPMVCGLEDWSRACMLLAQARAELAQRGEAFNERIPVGIMVEIPSAVLMADELAQTADFMSIGTNDLTQYLLAADRTNEHVAAYYRPYHPAVFRAINSVVHAAHRHRKWVGICGELAGMIPAIPALLGIGVDELSMSPPSLPEARHVVLGTSFDQAQGLAAEVLGMKDVESIEEVLTRNIAKE
jgi:phosphoenolpyruvate-protein phosphotransferase (PTS system enzyme I)